MSTDKELVKDIFLDSLSSVMPKNFIPENISFDDGKLKIKNNLYDLNDYKNVYVYGSGKASVEMAKAIKNVLGERIKKTLIVSNYYEDIKDIEVLESSHPLPSQKSIDSALRLLSEFSAMDRDDFFIYLLSGGSSALIEKPVDGVSLEDFIETTEILLKNSLSIDEINIIRKSLSQIKGGGLASKTKASGVVLVVSDVIGNDLNTIASAPMSYDDISLEDIKVILDKYNISNLLPNSVQYILENGLNQLEDKPSEFEHFILASNDEALKRAQESAKTKGLSSKIVTNSLQGDVEDVAKLIIEKVKELDFDVLLFAGEPTVNVKGNGEGGRNQELVLRVLKNMSKNDDFTFLSAGSDGIDGNSIAAGAVVDIFDLDDSIDNYLKNNDSYNYLKKHDSLIITGESGTNVMDIMIALKDK